MRYDFDQVIDRRGTDSSKWNVAENELPMWVADMDFQTAPEIIEAMRVRLEHGVFGYTEVPDAWYAAYQRWWGTRHGLTLEKDWLVFCTGVNPAISTTVRKLTTPNENVVIQTPVYNVFYNCIRNNGCRVLESPLRYEKQQFTMDLEDLEEKLADPQTSLMLLCNPHNPVGKIWDRDTLAAIGALAKKHHVTVIADEIHCDITDPGKDYVPFASVSEACREVSISCMAPTKTFNLAGLQTAAVCVPDPVLRHKVWRGLNTDEVAEPNVFAAVAATAAFEKGAPWLEELRAYIYENKKTVTGFIRRRIPEITVIEGEATYLMWLDVSALGGGSREIAAYLREKTGLFVSAGAVYGEHGGAFLRMNIACPKSVYMDGLNRLADGVRQWQSR